MCKRDLHNDFYESDNITKWGNVIYRYRDIVVLDYSCEPITLSIQSILNWLTLNSENTIRGDLNINWGMLNFKEIEFVSDVDENLYTASLELHK